MRVPFPAKKVRRAKALREMKILEDRYPQAATALRYENPFELLVAVILSAQSTDARVNVTTPTLFARYPNPAALAQADVHDVEEIVKSCGFFRMKARNVVRTAQAIVAEHRGVVPQTREELERLPGVGRKTASVVLSVAFEGAALAVDTHVFRVAHRLGLTLGKTPREVEADLTKLVPREKWRHAHHWLILHGRSICRAPVPRCEACPENTLCPTPPILARERRALRAAAVPKSPGARGAVSRHPRRSASKAKKG